MGVNQKRRARFQGRAESRAGAHKHVKESSAQRYAAELSSPVEKMSTGPAPGKRKKGVAERDRNASASTAIHNRWEGQGHQTA